MKSHSPLGQFVKHDKYSKQEKRKYIYKKFLEQNRYTRVGPHQ